MANCETIQNQPAYLLPQLLNPKLWDILQGGEQNVLSCSIKRLQGSTVLQGNRQSSAVEEGGRAGRRLWEGTETGSHLFSLVLVKSLSKCVLQGCPEQLSLCYRQLWYNTQISRWLLGSDNTAQWWKPLSGEMDLWSAVVGETKGRECWTRNAAIGMQKDINQSLSMKTW